MPDVPGTPAAPAAAPIANAPGITSDTSGKQNVPVSDATAAANLKPENAAEAAVIRKLKVGDTEYDETTLQQMIEKSKGADKKFLEASQARKEALRFFKLAKENPREFLEKTGLDPKKFAYDEVAKDIQEKLRDPKEVALEKAEAELKEFRAQKEVERQRFEEQRIQNEAKALRAKFEQDIIGALEKHPAIPKNAFSVAKIAKYIDTVRTQTGVLLSAEDVASTVEADLKQELNGVIKGATYDQLLSLIGEEGMATLRKGDIEKLKNPLKNNNAPAGGTASGQSEERKPKNSRDFWKDIDEGGKAEGFNKFGVRVRK
jgi:hypothetical protein